MGVNKNISIFMLFDCVQVNTGLGFHWICNRGEKGGYMWIDDDINLEPFFSITSVGCFWLVQTYQYGCHPSVLSHHMLGTAECDESYCIEGDHIWSFFRRDAGNFFTMSHTATRAASWPYMDFLKIQIFCDVSFGVDICPYMENGCVYGLIWDVT